MPKYTLTGGLHIYNRALSHKEILHNYKYPNSPVLRGLVALYWEKE